MATAVPHDTRRATGVPFLDLGPVHRPLKAELLAGVEELLEANAFVNGAAVARFEEAFAAYCGARLCVGMSSGLDALRLALLAAGLEPGDEVIVPAMTFAATVEAVLQAGGRPVLVDVREDDANVDVAAVEAAITPRTRFLLPVHLYGQMADVVGLMRVAARHGLAIVEDACQAHGATRDGVRAGTAGVAAAFSFYPGKNLGALGDAGAVVTDDDEVERVARALREHGQTRKYVHRFEGYTARLDAVQASALTCKLPHLDRWNASRAEAAALYLELLDGVPGVRLPWEAPRARHVWHLFTIRVAAPDELAVALGERGIGTGHHYPVPMHLCEAFAPLGHRRGEFPVAERIAAQTISLPLFPGITRDQVATVAHAVAELSIRG
jgi:dTDP-4-amino-4,6-dideoxygalactose transaminase